MLKDGNYAETETLLKNAMELEPGSWEAKMLYGTCRLLQGDTETAKRIHDELEPHFSADLDLPEAERTFWQKYHNWIILFLLGVILFLCSAFFGSRLLEIFLSDPSKTAPIIDTRQGLSVYRPPDNHDAW